MKQTKKIVLIGLICLAWQASGYAETEWTGTNLWNTDKNAFVIPDDGETYFLDSPYSLTADLIVTGTLEIKDSGILNVDGGTVTVYNLIYANVEPNIIINHAGNVIVLSGEIYNGDGLIRINSGGTLYNYYGDVEVDSGAIILNAGGIFDNVRGTIPESLTISAGGNLYDGTEVHLTKDLDLDYTWTITKKAVVRGYGNEIRLGTSGGIAIYGATASLLLDDVIISGIGGNKIRTTDTNSTLSLGNILWIQDSNTSYTLGNIFVNGEWTIAGDGTTFEYATNQVSTIDSNSGIRLLGTTLEYNTDDPNRINLVDDSTIIHLDQGAILATQALTLANGTLVTTGSSRFSGTATLDLQNVANIHSSGATIKIGDVVM